MQKEITKMSKVELIHRCNNLETNRDYYESLYKEYKMMLEHSDSLFDDYMVLAPFVTTIVVISVLIIMSIFILTMMG